MTDRTAMSADIEHLLRTEAPQVLGALVRRFGRFDIAEDAVQEALLAASRAWPVDGVPAEPAQLADPDRLPADGRSAALRPGPAPARAASRDGRAGHAGTGPPYTPQETDDSLTLLLLCCHPALSATSQVALTLRAVGGLTTAEIAHAYGSTESHHGARGSAAPNSSWLVPAPASPRPPPPTATAGWPP